MIFNQKEIEQYEERLKTFLGNYIFSRQKELILDLVAPHAGENVLNVGCGTGDYLQLFRDKWCSITGVDCSAEMVEHARKKLGDNIELHLGEAEDLPFSDNEFDIVTMINALEISKDPQKAIGEAIRVCRGRIFISFLNKFCFVGTQHRLKELFGFPVSANIRFFSVNEIKKMITGLVGSPEIRWGSVIYFPSPVYHVFTELEELIPSDKNPFGAFVGLTFSVHYTFRTVQSPVMESFQLSTESQETATSAVRGMLKEVSK